MTSPQKRKGHAAERAVVKWLRTYGFKANRVQAGRPDDQGDIEGLPGVVIEVKDRKQHNFEDYFTQLRRQIQAKDAWTGVIILKRRGQTDPADWIACMPAYEWIALLPHWTQMRDKERDVQP